MKLNRKTPPLEEIIEHPKRKLNKKPPAPVHMIDNHWEVVTVSEHFCFVCDKKFKPGERKINIGPGLNRHNGHDSNSEAWRKKFQHCKTLGR